MFEKLIRGSTIEYRHFVQADPPWVKYAITCKKCL